MNDTPKRSSLRLLALICSIMLAAAFVIFSAGAILLPSSKSGRAIHYDRADADETATTTQPTQP